MKELLTVYLKQVRFFAFHGLYAEEQKTGNEFEVDLAVNYAPSSGLVTDISETISYADLYAIVLEQMKEPVALLETLAMTITSKIHEKFPQVKKIEISIDKLNPPITGIVGRVGTSFRREFS
jgi:7,8-dihydroneopterin aldolase/epimerase/oxygenase